MNSISLKINYSQNNLNPCHTKSDGLKRSLPSHNTCQENYSLNARHLASKFNITFKGDIDSQLDNFCEKLEKKIQSMVTPKDIKIVETVLTPKTISAIEDVFNDDNIGSIYYTGLSLNAVLRYLENKKQLDLKGDQKAFIIDSMSLYYLQKQGKKFQDDIAGKNIKFYCLETDDKESEGLINQFNQLTDNKFPVKVIPKNINSEIANYPDAKTLKTIIKAYAEYKFPNDSDSKERFIDVLCRYLDENLIVFSYASLYEKLKEHYKNIEAHLCSKGKSMKDAVYVIPKKDKSYSIINYLYAIANNVPLKQFIDLDDIENEQNKGKTYIVLDDLSASGSSAEQDAMILRHYVNNVTLAPLIGFKSAEDFIKTAKLNEKEIEMDFLPLINYKDLGFIKTNIYWGKRFPESSSEFDKINKEYVRGFKDFNMEDICFMFEHVRGGCSSTYSMISFPYMIPDNSMELNAFIGGYCLNRDIPNGNKAVASSMNGTTGIISQKEYDVIKKEIQKI